MHATTDEIISGFDRAYVWFCDLDDDPQVELTGRSMLSLSERARAARLQNMLERRRFMARCAFVRRRLGCLSGVAPAALEFRHDAHGKPSLAFPAGAESERPAALKFNLSHSENVLALAVAFDREVGVDIEVVRPGVDFLAVAETLFTTAEFISLRALSGRERTREFYRLWTRHETLAKVDGRGIASPSTAERAADSSFALHAFEFNFGGKEIIGALALGAEAVTRQANGGWSANVQALRATVPSN